MSSSKDGTEAGENKAQPAFDAQGKEIVQIGIVVKDAVATARRFSEILGLGPWTFFDEVFNNAKLHGEPLEPEAGALRMGFGYLGAMEIELLEPLYGPSTHMEFLNRHGEGLHHMSLGGQEDYREFRSALMKHGCNVEMEGVSTGPFEFIYMSTQRQLGTIVEIVSPLTEDVMTNLAPWGTLPAPEISMVDFTSKEVVRVGIVTDDLDATVKNYQEIFGIGPWQIEDLEPPAATVGRLHGVSLDRAMNFQIRRAVAGFGRLELELLEPVSGPTPPMICLKKHGPGLFQLNLGPVPDHDEMLYSLRRGGIDMEMTWRRDNGGPTVTLLDTQKPLGARFEIERLTTNS